MGVGVGDGLGVGVGVEFTPPPPEAPQAASNTHADIAGKNRIQFMETPAPSSPQDGRTKPVRGQSQHSKNTG